MSRMWNHDARVTDNRQTVMDTQEDYLLNRIWCLQREVSRLTHENEQYKEMMKAISRAVFRATQLVRLEKKDISQQRCSMASKLISQIERYEHDET